jgi:hypothetical protein
MSAYRLGRHRPENIYRVVDDTNSDNDLYIAHACNPDDAQLIVYALNRMADEQEDSQS